MIFIELFAWKYSYFVNIVFHPVALFSRILSALQSMLFSHSEEEIFSPTSEVHHTRIDVDVAYR